MPSSSSFSSLISRTDKGDTRGGQQVLKTASFIKTVECRGVPVPESRHPPSLNEVSAPQKNDGVRKLPIIEELERMNRHNLPHMFEGSVDLRPLTSLLSSASEVFEPDVLWDHDTLLRELASLEFKLNNEKVSGPSSGDANKTS